MTTTLYALLTWTTRGRAPLIDASVASFLERFLPDASERLGAKLMALGIVSNHVHAVIQFSGVLDAPKLVQGLKGASARIANRDGIATAAPLRWASGYDLRSISPGQLSKALSYVRGQANRHPGDAVRPSRP